GGDDVRSRIDGEHAGHLLCGADVDLLDFPMGVAAANDDRMGEVWKCHIVGVAAATLYQGRVFLARDGLADGKFLDRPGAGIVVHVHGDAKGLGADRLLRVNSNQIADRDDTYKDGWRMSGSRCSILTGLPPKPAISRAIRRRCAVAAHWYTDLDLNQ